MTSDPRISPLSTLICVTIFGVTVFSAPATMPQHPAAVPFALAITAWCLTVTILGLRTLRQVGLSRSGILAPVLVLLVACMSFLFAATTIHLLMN